MISSVSPCEKADSTDTEEGECGGFGDRQLRPVTAVVERGDLAVVQGTDPDGVLSNAAVHREIATIETIPFADQKGK